jgi:hypothetical protein
MSDTEVSSVVTAATGAVGRPVASPAPPRAPRADPSHGCVDWFSYPNDDSMPRPPADLVKTAVTSPYGRQLLEQQGAQHWLQD